MCDTVVTCLQPFTYIHLSMLLGHACFVSSLVASTAVSLNGAGGGGGGGAVSTPPASRGIMSSPYMMLAARPPEHAFAHIHPPAHHQASNCSVLRMRVRFCARTRLPLTLPALKKTRSHSITPAQHSGVTARHVENTRQPIDTNTRKDD